MRSILIDDEVYDAIAAHTTHPGHDTPNHVLRRLLGLPAAARPDDETTTADGTLPARINATPPTDPPAPAPASPR